MRCALVHDWLVEQGGAEQVLKQIHRLFPGPIYSLVRGKSWDLREVKTSPLGYLPGVQHYYRALLPLFFSANKRHDLREYDFILSSSHAVAKAIKKTGNQLHICYCHTPMRYIWDLTDYYWASIPPKLRDLLVSYLRKEDCKSAENVDYFIANSRTVADRIKKYYGRESTIIYPPVDIKNFRLEEKKEAYYLAFSRLVGYKRIDLVVEAFRHLPERQLVVLGRGPQLKKMIKKAPPNVTFLGFISDVAQIVGRARALIFPAEEDFGIIPVEAQSCGTPVLAYRKGGATETVTDGVSGLFFEEQSVQAILDVIQRFEAKRFVPHEIRQSVLRFSTERFIEEYRQFVKEKIAENFGSGRRVRQTPMASRSRLCD